MYTTSKAISELIKSYLNVRGSSTEYRLIIPGFTKNISSEIHENLKKSGIKSFLVVTPDSDIETDPLNDIYSYYEVTSLRFGSFILICSPGVLPLLQDSIKSPGAPIKDITINEEWPWKADAIEGFEWKRFLGEFLSTKNEDYLNFINVVFKHVIESCKTLESGKREALFFEKVLNFNPGVYDAGQFERVVKLIGLPYDSKYIKNNDLYKIKLNKYFEKIEKVIRFVKQEIYKADFSRTKYIENFIQSEKSSKYPEVDNKKINELFNSLLDSIDFFPDNLLFSSFFKTNSQLWKLFSIEFLEDLFQIPDEESPNEDFIKIIKTRIIDREIQTISEFENKIVVFLNEEIEFEVDYGLTEVKKPVLRISRGQSLIKEPIILNENFGKEKIVLNTFSILRGKQPKGAVRITLSVFDGDSNLNIQANIQLIIISNSRPQIFLLYDSKGKVFTKDFESKDNVDKEDEITEYSVSGYVNCFILSYGGLREINTEPTEGIKIEEVNDACFIYQIPEQSSGINPEYSKEGTFSIIADSEEKILNVLLTSLIDEEKGYSIFDEIIETIEKGKRENARALLEAIHNKGLYKKGLGKKTNELVRKGELSEHFEKNGAFPVLIKKVEEVPFISKTTKKEHAIITLDNGIHFYKEQEKLIESFPRILTKKTETNKISSEVSELIKEYEVERNALISFFHSALLEEKLDRPLYASCFYFIPSEKDFYFVLLTNYLKAYLRILELLENNDFQLNSFEKFVLTHLDSLVLFDDNFTEGLTLISPWHPISLFSSVSLFKIMYPLLKRTEKEGRYEKNINRLISIIYKNEPIKWFSFFDINQSEFEKSLCFSSNDFGWKILVPAATNPINLNNANPFFEFIEKLFSLNVMLPIKGISESFSGHIRNYHKVYPSNRKIWIKLNKNFKKLNVFNTFKKHLANNGELSKYISLLPGGIHCIFPDNEFDDIDFENDWPEELGFYFYNKEPESYTVDINIIEAFDKIQKAPSDKYQVRGNNEFTILREPIFETREDGDGFPISKIHEIDTFNPEKVNEDELENIFLKSSSILSRIKEKNSLSIKTNFSFNELQSNWSIIPSTSIDPQILNKKILSIFQNGALWDYKLSFDENFSSYFVLSKIPSQLIDKLKKTPFFESLDSNFLSQIISEISQSGISIGKDALSSTNKLYGSIGFIGSIMCLRKSIIENKNTIGFLISVDSFQSILEPSLNYMKEEDSVKNAKYSDLIIFQIKLKGDQIYISFSSIESKFSKEEISEVRLNHGIEQAKITSETIRTLIEKSGKDDGILERLALKSIIFYGLRSKTENTDLTSQVLKCIINGKIKYCQSTFPQILVVSTERNTDKKTQFYPGSLLRINLSPGFWPTDPAFRIQEIEELFSKCFNEKILTNETSIHLVKTVDQEKNTSSISVNNKTDSNVLKEKIDRGEEKEIVNSENWITSKSFDEVMPLKFDMISKNERLQIVSNVYEYLLSQRIGVRNADLESVDFAEGPSFYKIEIQYDDVGAYPKIQNMLTQLNLLLKLREGLKVRIYSDLGKIWLEVPKMENQKIKVGLEEYLWPSFQRDNYFRIPFGVDNNGDVISINLSSSKSPHFLLGGKTGSGKSVLLDTLIKGATNFYSPEELKISMIDPKGTELIEFENLPHTLGPNGESTEDAIKLLEKAIAEMERRYKIFKDLYISSPEYGKIKDISDFNARSEVKLPWWLLVIDEYADIVEVDSSQRRIIESQMKKLSQKARAAGIHIIVATQRPSGDIINTTVRANLPGKIALAVDSATNSRIILDEPGAESLSGKGEALFKGDQEGGLIRVQCAISGS